MLPPPLVVPKAPRVPPSSPEGSFFGSRSVWVILGLVAVAGVGLLLLPGAARSPAPSATSSTSSVPPATTTTGPPTTTTQAVPVAPQPTPEAAARALVESGWARGNRPVALSVATVNAVDTLFAVPYPPGLAVNRGCEHRRRVGDLHLRSAGGGRTPTTPSTRSSSSRRRPVSGT